MEALALYESGICQDCGYHHSLTENLDNIFEFEIKTCNTCAGTARYSRAQARADDRARSGLHENAPPETPDPADGRKVYLKLTRTKSSSDKPPAAPAAGP